MSPDHPDRIGPYLVKERIGIGTIADIYRATDTAHNRDVAIKLLKEDMVRRYEPYLRHRAELADRLNHPAIPACYGYFHDDEGAYLVLELIEGTDLLRLLEEYGQPLPPQHVTAWMIQVCDVLTFLHTQSEPLLFRDLKPSNIMVRPDGGIHLVDFDIVMSFQPGQHYDRIGTEGYAPPEQYAGLEDPRSDLYALGATMHHLLTGRDPTHQLPFAFRETPPSAINPAVSPALEAVIFKALAYRPVERYQTAAEMKQALLACL